MSDHLPECWGDNDFDWSAAPCICDRLRACEARVGQRIDAMLAKAIDYGERTGYAAALDAARDAVALPETRSISSAIKSMAERERQYDVLIPVFDDDYEAGQRDEREKWSVLIKDRIRDLQSCTKHDDCMGKADILLVILDDYDYGVAREEKS